MATATRKAINANIILYGPAVSGKTSNIQFIHRKLKPSQRGQVSSLCQDGYPHVSYEFLPIELGELKGYETNLYIYTAPSHDDGLETRLNLLNEAAGVVFIADSNPARLDDNLESLTNLKEELRWWDIDYDSFPIVFQFNKRDLPNAMSIEELEAQLNPEGRQHFEAIASAGQGVRDTFSEISKMAVKHVRLKLLAEESGEAPKRERKKPLPEAQPGTGPRLVVSGAASETQKSETTLDQAPPPREVTLEEVSMNEEVPPQDDLTPVVERPVSDSAHTTLEAAAAPAVAPTPEPSADAEGEPEPEEVPFRPPALLDFSLAEKAAPDESAERPELALDEKNPPPADKESEEGSAEVPRDFDSPDEYVGPQEDRDFLSTEFPSSQSDEDVYEVGAAVETEWDDEEDIQPRPFLDEELPYDGPRGRISLSRSTELAPLSLATSPLEEPELRIQTYEEDDEDDRPVIRLGSRAEEEELQLEEDMLDMADDTTDLEEVEHDDEKEEDEQTDASQRASVEAAIATSPQAEPPLVEEPLEPEAPELEEKVSLEVVDEEEPVFEMKMESPAPTPAEGTLDLPEEALRQTEVLPPAPTPTPAEIIMDFPEGDGFIDEEGQEAASAIEQAVHEEHELLPEIALAPLEEARPVLEPSEEDIFGEVVISTPAPTPEELFDVVGQESKPGLETTSQPHVEEIRPAPTPEPTEAGEDPQIVSWGETIRLDERTLLLPVDVRIPSVDRTFQLSVSIRVEQLLDALLKGPRA